MERFWSKVDIRDTNECWPWKGFTNDGYGMFWLDGKPQRASRVAWALRLGAVPDGLMVLHRCDVRACVNSEHLFLGTHADNMRDMREKGRSVCPAKEHPELMARGVRAGAAKLDDDKVVIIRQMSLDGCSQRKIAAVFGVDRKTVAKVIRRETWAHVREQGAA